MKIDDTTLKEQLIERFFTYVQIPSQSDQSATQLPSSLGQMKLARHLKKELQAMHIDAIELTDDAILTACLTGDSSLPAIGFVAHLDTFDAGLSDQVHPQILHKEVGKDLCLNKEADIWLREDQINEIKAYNNQDIIVTDGTSVLGADNKASITILMTLAESLLQDKSIPHGDIWLCFVPDEEIGLRGAKALDPKRLPVEAAYTIDCNEVGELIYETFHAASAQLTIEGVSAHPMSAKNVMINPIMLAHDAISMLNRAAMPEHTEGREGYIWPVSMQAHPGQATLDFHIRDHDKNKFEAKKERLNKIREWLSYQYPSLTIDLDIEDVYQNIADSIDSPEESCVYLLKQAMLELDITPNIIAMRGGTDGSALSSKGIPTPNYFTGAHQFHSRYEFLPVESFLKSYRVTEKLIQLWAENK